MKREEAKQLLELCRPEQADDLQDPALAEAFALLETDTELRAWFDEQQAVDTRISGSLNALEAPADLKASILAGMRLHQAHASGEQRSAAAAPHDLENEIAFPSAKTRPEATWFKPWMGIAAIFAIMMVIFNLPTNEPVATSAPQTALAGLPPVIQFLSQEIDSLKAFDKRDHRAENLKTFLASSQSPFPQTLPHCLNEMPTIGCITFEYEDAKLSMICFKNGEVYHLITADKATYPDALPTEPEVFQCSDKAFRIWVDGEQVKILTVHGTKEDIPEFI